MRMNQGLGDLLPAGVNPDAPAATQPVSAIDTLINSTADAINRIIPLWQQVKTFNAQLAVAKKQALATGSMIDPNKITVPGIPVQAGLDTNTKLLIGGGIALIAIIMLTKKRR